MPIGRQPRSIAILAAAPPSVMASSIQCARRSGGIKVNASRIRGAESFVPDTKCSTSSAVIGCGPSCSIVLPLSAGGIRPILNHLHTLQRHQALLHHLVDVWHQLV